MSLRSLLRDNAHAELATWAATLAPGRLQAIHLARPESWGSWPMAYIGAIRMDLTHGGQIRQAVGQVDVVFAGAPVQNGTLAEALDDLADEWVEWTTDRPHLFGSNTVQEPMRVASASLSVGDVAYDAVVVTLGRILITEGRT